MKIDVALIIMAFDDHSGTVAYYLNRDTGEVVTVLTHRDYLADMDQMPDDPAAEIDDHPERFLSVDPLPSHEAFEVMEDFIRTLPDGPPRRVLTSSLGARHPFRAFKDGLHGWPEIRSAWFEFHDRTYRTKAALWLHASGIEPDSPAHDADLG